MADSKKVHFSKSPILKVYWLARMAQNFDQAKRDNTFWPTPNILGGSVSSLVHMKIIFY